jgi:hypothetical protein
VLDFINARRDADKQLTEKDLKVGSYELFGETEVYEEITCSKKVITEFVNDAQGQPTTRKNADFGNWFWQVTHNGKSCKVATKDVKKGKLAAGKYNLFVFNGEARPSFSLSSESSYTKSDALQKVEEE